MNGTSSLGIIAVERLSIVIWRATFGLFAAFGHLRDFGTMLGVDMSLPLVEGVESYTAAVHAVFAKDDPSQVAMQDVGDELIFVPERPFAPRAVVQRAFYEDGIAVKDLQDVEEETFAPTGSRSDR